jgi:hypothetical protein
MVRTFIKIFIAFLFCSIPGYAQKGSDIFFSSEARLIYPQYFTKYEQKFNDGIGGLFIGNMKRLRFKTGLLFTTKNYLEQFESTSLIDKITYNLDYFNIPMLFDLELRRRDSIKNQYFFSPGIVFNIPRNYKSITYYKNGTPSTLNEAPDNYNFGSSARLGFIYQRKLTRLLNINIETYVDYKFQLDYLEFNNSSPHWHSSYSNDRLSLGINLGIEWLYKKR